MTSPNAGKITLGVDLDSAGIRKKLEADLSKAVIDKIVPEIDRLNQRFNEVNRTIGEISAAPLDEISRYSRLAALENEKLQNSIAQTSEKQAELNQILDEQVELERDLQRARRNSSRWRREERREIEETGRVSERVRNKLAEWDAAETVLLNDQDNLRRRSRALGHQIDNARIASAKAVARSYTDEANEHQRAVDKIIDNARRLSLQEARDERNRMRRAEKEQKRQREESKRRLKSPLEAGGQIIRSLSGLSLGVSPGALAIMASAALTLAGALASASKALWSLPAGITALGVAFASVNIGMMGFSDTIGALIDGDLEKFAELINKLSPNAQQAALAIQQLGPQFSALKTAVQDALFNDVAQMITTVGNAYLPSVQNILSEVAGSLNRFLGNALRQLLTPEGAQSISTIFANIAKAFKALEPAAAPFTKAILGLLEATSGLLPEFFNWLTKLANQFSDFVEKNKDNGKFVEWIRQGVDTLGDLLRLAVGFGKAIAALAPIAEMIFPYIVTILEEIARLLEKYPGLLEAALGAFIVGKIVKGLKGIGEVFGLLGIGFGKLKEVAVKAAGAIAAAFTGVNTGALATTATILSRIGMVLAPIASFMGGSWLGNKLAESFDGQDLGWLDRLRMAGTNITGGPIPQDIFDKLTPDAQAALQAGQTDPNRRLGSGRYDAPDIPVLTQPPVGGELPNPLQSTLDLLTPNNPLPVQEVDPLKPDDLGTLLPGGFDPGSVVPGAVTGPGGTPIPIDPNKQSMAAVSPGQTVPGTDPDLKQSLDDLLDLFKPDLSGVPPGGGWGADPALPVPPAPATGPDGKPLSESDLRKQIRDSIDPSKFAVDPYAPIGGVNNQPGYPGRPPLSVSVENLPSIPGMSGIPMMPGVPLPSLSGLPDAMGANTQIDVLKAIAAQAPFNLNFISGLRAPGSTTPNSYHDSGQAGDFSNGSAPTAQMRAFAEYMAMNFRPYISELIYNDDRGGIGIHDGNFVDANSFYGSEAHRNHVHVAIRDEVANQFLQALQGVPRSLKDNMFAVNGPLTMDPATGQSVFSQVDQQAVFDADSRLRKTAADLQAARVEEAYAIEARKQNLVEEMDVIEARQRVQELERELISDQASLSEAMAGKVKNSRGGLDLDSLPYGHPLKVLGGVLTGMGASTDEVAALLGGGAGMMGGVTLPGPMGFSGTPTAPSTDLSQLAQERNPLFFAQAAGVNVPDFSRFGGGPGAQNVMANQGPPSDALGRVYSDTAALIDRTFTNSDAADKARHDQVMAVLNEVKDRLSEDVLQPIVTEGISAGMNGLKDATTAAIGTSLGQAAGPPIAAAVQAAVPPATPGNNGAPGIPLPLPVPTFDEGGLWPSGTLGANLSGSSERVLSPSETRLFDSGLLGGWNLQPLQQQFATVEGIDANRVLGADFFGVSQVPILGFLLNILVSILLKVIDVEIETRDTLDEISKDFRDFRGDFAAVDAAGRLRSDTSGLVDRTTSSERAAADERIRILKLVLEGLIKFIVEKVIIPISKAVGNALLSVAGQLASGAISGGMGAAFPGGSIVGGAIGNVVSSLITSAGSTAIDITAEVASKAVEAIADVGLEALGQAMFSAFPGLTQGLFGGGLLAALFDPITQVLNGILGGITMAVSALFGGLASLIPGLPFDEGGVAVGSGLMPKATLAPERVLSPRQTALFDKMVSALESGSFASSTRTTTINAPFTVTGNEKGGRVVHDRLLALMS